MSVAVLNAGPRMNRLPPPQLAALAIRDRLASFSAMTELMGFDAVRDFGRRYAR